jgi:hypothetical protein
MVRNQLTPQILDSITCERRKVRWPKIQAQIKRHHSPGEGGFNTREWNNIIRILNRYHKRQTVKKVPEKEIILVQTLITAKRASVYVDHMIDRMKETGLIIKGDLKQEHRFWESTYRSLLERLKADKTLINSERIYKKMREVENFTWAPGSLIIERKKHWPRIKKILGSGKITTEIINKEIDKILHSKRSPKYKAKNICFVVSLYADVLERRRQNPINWTRAYKETMLENYNQISHHTDVFEQIIDLE